MGYEVPATGCVVPHGLTVTIAGPGKTKRQLSSGCRVNCWMKVLDVSDKTLAKKAGIESTSTEAPKAKAASKSGA